jgi:hypothetical protein
MSDVPLGLLEGPALPRRSQHGRCYREARGNQGTNADVRAMYAR